MGASVKTYGRLLLGEILFEHGLITKEQLEQALRIQVGGLRRLGAILIRMKLIKSDDLTEALSEQLKLPIVNVADEFHDNARAVLPRYLCRKYSVLPLSLESNNVLRLAMVDPLDGVAIAEVEHYAGCVVQPVLARLHDIERAIPSRTEFTSHDIFNPQVYHSVAKAAVVAAICLFAVTGVLVYREIHVQKYGTVSRVDGSVIFKNHDLMIDVSKDGSIYFSGRGAYANGYYGVRFDNASQLTAFVKGAVRQFSSEQVEWMNWAFREKLKAGDTLVAAKSP